MARRIIGISLDDKLLSKLDKTRELVPRSRYVEKVLAEVLDKNE